MKKQTAQNIPISQIDEGERRRKEYGNIAELAESIKFNGLTSPIAVIRKGPNSYLLAAGGRRLRAVKSLKWDTIPAVVYEEADNLDLRTIELIENVQRLDLTWHEKCALEQEIHELMVAKHGSYTSHKSKSDGWSAAKTAALLGVSPATLSLDLQLNDAVKIVPELKEFKTQAEARRAMEKASKDVENAEMVRTIEAEQKLTGNEDKAKRKLIDSFIVGDFLIDCDKVPDASCDIAEIDPPYGVDFDKMLAAQGTPDPHYKEVPDDQYIQFLYSVLKRVYKKLKPDAWCLLWFATGHWYDEVLLTLIEAGFTPQKVPAMWVKNVGRTLSPKYQLANSYETFIYARKGDAVIERQGRNATYEYSTIPDSRRRHPAERPVELIGDILTTFGRPGDRVLVPFLGSGNTILSASNCHMSAVGFDLSPENKAGYTLAVHEGTVGEFK